MVRLTDRLDMTIVVDWDDNKTNKQRRLQKMWMLSTDSGYATMETSKWLPKLIFLKILLMLSRVSAWIHHR